MSPKHEVELAASAERDLERLSGNAAKDVQKFLDGPLRDNPHRAGEPLAGPRTGTHEALGDGWRVLYQVDDDRLEVRVVVIARRLDTVAR
ncbi:MAG: type II toxin-antitoxin system RelE family toxin [Frankia sp.]